MYIDNKPARDRGSAFKGPHKILIYYKVGKYFYEYYVIFKIAILMFNSLIVYK